MKRSIAFFVATILLNGCATSVTTRGACTVHKEIYCDVDTLGNFKNGETWESCKRKPRFSQSTIDTLPRSTKNELAADKTWIMDHCP